MRDPKHKPLLDAIIDGEVDIQELSKRAAEIGATLGERLTTAAKALAERIISHRITQAQAEKMFRLFYVELTLVGFCYVAQQVVDVATKNHEAVRNGRATAGDVKQVGRVGTADKKARAAERARG